MLTDDERQQILDQEVAGARAQQTRRQELKRKRAAQTYRRAVRSALRPRARIVAAALGTLALVAGLSVAFLHGEADAPDDTAGGIATSVLMQRCEAALRARVGRDDLRFPARQDAEQQVSASADGKRWDGSFLQTENGAAPTRTDFSCTYTLATDQTTTDLISP